MLEKPKDPAKLTLTEKYPLRPVDLSAEQYVFGAFTLLAACTFLVGVALFLARGFTEVSGFMLGIGAVLTTVLFTFTFFFVGAEEIVEKEWAKRERLEAEGTIAPSRGY